MSKGKNPTQISSKGKQSAETRFQFFPHRVTSFDDGSRLKLADV